MCYNEATYRRVDDDDIAMHEVEAVLFDLLDI